MEGKVVNANVAAFSFCNWATQPLLPFLTESLGTDAVGFGYFQTAEAIMQLIGSPIMGSVMDQRGFRWGLIVSQLSACVAFATLGVSEFIGLWLFFLSRVPTLFMHSMASAQLYVAQSSPAERRLEDLGHLTLYYGLGFLLGPLLGGRIAAYFGNWSVGVLSSFVCLSLTLVNVFLLPSSKRVGEGKKDDDLKDGKKDDDLVWEEKKSQKSKFWSLLKQPEVRNLLIAKFLVGSGISVMRSSILFFVKTEIGFKQEDVGYLMSFIGLLAALMNVLGFKFLKNTLTLTDAQILKSCALSLSITFFFLFPLVSTPLHVYLVVIPMAGGISALYTTSTSLLTMASPPSSSGAVIGMGHGVRTLCNSIGPLLAGYVSTFFGFGAVFGVCGGFCALGFLFVQMAI